MPRLSLLTILSLILLSGAAVLRADDDGDKDKDKEKCCCRWHWHSDAGAFAWQAQLDSPVKGLGQSLDQRTGLGLGAQWNHDHEDGHVSRTRIEWNVFPQGPGVGPAEVQTKASNYLLSFDRLYHFSGSAKGPYILAGLGAVRWFVDQAVSPGQTRSFHATKLAVTAGAGYRFNPSFSAEARYLLSSLDQSFDGSMVQVGLNMRF